MSFVVGDSVRVLDEDSSGTIVKVVSAKCYSVHVTQIDFVQEYTACDLILDESLDPGNAIQKDLGQQHKSIQKVRPSESTNVVDLHFGKLVDYPGHFSPHERLDFQMNYLKKELDFARSTGANKLIVIHGHGKGVLHKKVVNYLKTLPKIEFYDAEWRRYKGGAQEVRFLQ